MISRTHANMIRQRLSGTTSYHIGVGSGYPEVAGGPAGGTSDLADRIPDNVALPVPNQEEFDETTDDEGEFVDPND